MAFSDTLHKVTIQTSTGVVECVGGSYAGVSFFVQETTKSGGRNVVSTALPSSDEHVNEDLGERVPSYTINWYLLGDDAEAQWQKLEAAFLKRGAFELVHPEYGKFQARCTNYSSGMRSNESGYKSGSATFVPESDAKPSSFSTVDVHGVGMEMANNSADEAASSFKSRFSVIGKAKSVVDSCVNATVAVLDVIEGARQSVRDVNTFVSQLSQIRDNIGLILLTPSDFIDRIERLVMMTKETFDFSDEAFTDYVNESLVMMDEIEIEEAVGVSSTLSSEIQRASLMFAAVMAARSAMNATYESADEVHAMREKISTVFENAMEKVTEQSDYMALANLAAVVDQYLREIVANLAVIVDYPLATTRDALSVCYDCYGSLDRFQDLLNRNSIFDPMTITRESVKVLSK